MLPCLWSPLPDSLLAVQEHGRTPLSKSDVNFAAMRLQRRDSFGTLDPRVRLSVVLDSYVEREPDQCPKFGELRTLLETLRETGLRSRRRRPFPNHRGVGAARGRSGRGVRTQSRSVGREPIAASSGTYQGITEQGSCHGRLAPSDRCACAARLEQTRIARSRLESTVSERKLLKR